MISVCMATYNGQKYIKEQIDSILCQLSEDDELVVSDDHSSDKTVDIISSYHDDRIKIYENVSRLGVTHNFEHALNLSKGDIILFLCINNHTTEFINKERLSTKPYPLLLVNGRTTTQFYREPAYQDERRE